MYCSFATVHLDVGSGGRVQRHLSKLMPFDRFGICWNYRKESWQGRRTAKANKMTKTKYHRKCERSELQKVVICVIGLIWTFARYCSRTFVLSIEPKFEDLGSSFYSTAVECHLVDGLPTSTRWTGVTVGEEDPSPIFSVNPLFRPSLFSFSCSPVSYYCRVVH